MATKRIQEATEEIEKKTTETINSIQDAIEELKKKTTEAVESI